YDQNGRSLGPAKIEWSQIAPDTEPTPDAVVTMPPEGDAGEGAKKVEPASEKREKRRRRRRTRQWPYAAVEFSGWFGVGSEKLDAEGGASSADGKALISPFGVARNQGPAKGRSPGN